MEIFGLLLIPEFSMLPVTAAIEPLRLANRTVGEEIYRWYTISMDGKPVMASNGTELHASLKAEELPAKSSIIVCGGENIQNHNSKPVMNWLRRRSRLGDNIGSVCTGCHILAEAGLLDGYRCTIHWENLPSFAENFPEIEVSGNLYEIDRNRCTCAGGTAALDMMLAIITAQQGEDVAASVADMIIHAPIRHHSEHQRRSLPARIGTRHPKLNQIIQEMETNIEDPVRPAELAKRVGLSPRQIERLFKRYLQRTPKRYYLELRLQKSRLLLLQTDMSVINVALSCGFSSPSHFSKCYRAFYGKTPYRERGTSSSNASGVTPGIAT